MTGERTMITSDLEMVLRWHNHLDVCGYIYTPHQISRVESMQCNAARHLLIFEQLSVPWGFLSITEYVLDSVSDCEFYLASEASRRTGRSMDHQHKLGVIQQGLLRNQYSDGEIHQTVIHFGLQREASQAIQREVRL